MAKKNMRKIQNSRMSVSGMPSMPYKSVHVEPAENGYVIRCYTGDGGDKTIVAKNEDEAKTVMMKMMGMES